MEPELIPKNLKFSEPPQAKIPPTKFGHPENALRGNVIDVAGFKFYFPYQPYPAQRAIISNSFAAFCRAQNALLESPTGTGKSIALLSSALAFQTQFSGSTRIIYASRTHSQLKQMVDEYRRLPYRSQMTYLGSRKQMCINPNIDLKGDVNTQCDLAVSTNCCPYYHKDPPFPAAFFEEKFSIEDLKQFGNDHNICPYTLAKSISSHSEIIFCPYNYVITASNPLLLNQSDIIIFDEAHNIETLCRDESTFEMTFLAINRAYNDSIQVPPTFKYYALFMKVRSIAGRILQWMRESSESEETDTPYVTAKYTSTVLRVFEMDPTTLTIFKEQLKKFVEEAMQGRLALELAHYHAESVYVFCDNLVNLLLYMTPQTTEDFKVVYAPDQANDSVENSKLQIICLRPGLCFSKISQKVRSVVLVSGTLSPMKTFLSELETPFHVVLEAPHVISQEQLFVTTFSRFEGQTISTRYALYQQCKRDIVVALGRSINKILSVVFGGCILFVPSYAHLKDIQDIWDEMGLIDACPKSIIFESANKDVKKTRDRFLKDPHGPLLVAVCRGKLSEGVDFFDDQCRVVFLFGIPYPNYKAPEVELKKQYNNFNVKKSLVSGHEWYDAEAYRSLFQATGRCIRHKNDYGAIILMDERFPNNLEKFAKWYIDSYYPETTIDRLCDYLRTFMHENELKRPPPLHQYTKPSYNDGDTFVALPTPSLEPHRKLEHIEKEIQIKEKLAPAKTRDIFDVSSSSSDDDEVETISDVEELMAREEKRMASKPQPFELFCNHCHKSAISIIDLNKADFIIKDPQMMPNSTLARILEGLTIVVDDAEPTGCFLDKPDWIDEDALAMKQLRCSCGKILGAYVTMSSDPEITEKFLLAANGLEFKAYDELYPFAAIYQAK